MEQSHAHLNKQINELQSLSNKNMYNLTNLTKNLKQDIYDTTAMTRKQTLDTQNSCNGMVIQIKKDVSSAMDSVTASENSAIMSINSSCANKHKKDINDLNSESLKIIEKLHASKTIGITSVNEIERLVECMKQEIKSQYETYEETLMEHSDNRKNNSDNGLIFFLKGLLQNKI
jgi:hypothetical protein